jgi:hypothetical protein
MGISDIIHDRRKTLRATRISSTQPKRAELFAALSSGKPSAFQESLKQNIRKSLAQINAAETDAQRQAAIEQLPDVMKLLGKWEFTRLRLGKYIKAQELKGVVTTTKGVDILRSHLKTLSTLAETLYRVMELLDYEGDHEMALAVADALLEIDLVYLPALENLLPIEST